MLDEIAAEIRQCRRCALHETRTLAVPGEGDPQARIMLIGEAPGAQEDLRGRPFVGPAGQLLDELLTRAGLQRQDVFITNIVKCRPPGNRDPLPEEVAACRDFLFGQIAAINPKVVCTLGRPALQALIDPNASIGREHGKPRYLYGKLFVPLYHPAAALHQQSLRPELVADMARLEGFIRDALSMHDQHI